ncbi:MAG: nucleotidyltransferase domain-containing protein [Candidatus Woesearchaeota archaeon]
MWKDSKKFSQLKNNWKNRWKEELIDILIFGSAVKGKLAPHDIDICLIFKDKPNLKLVREVESLLGEKYHINFLNAENFFQEVHSLSKTIFFEGASILTGKKLSEAYGLMPKLLYAYDLSPEAPSKKVRFVYLLRGRNGSEGLVKKFSGEFVSNSAFLIPLEKDKEMQEVLEQWKIKYTRRKLMLMN